MALNFKRHLAPSPGRVNATAWVAAFVLLIAMLVSVDPAKASTKTFTVRGVTYTRTVHSPNRLAELSRARFTISIAPTVLSAGHNGVFQFNSTLENFVDMANAPIFGSTVNNNGNDYQTIGDCTPSFVNYSACGSLVIFKDGVISKVSLPSTLPLDQHGLAVDDNGNYWGLIASEKKCDSTFLVCGPDPTTTQYIDCQVVNFTSEGKILGTWNASDHLPISEIKTSKWLNDGFYVGKIADPFHCNSVDISDGKILISMRHTDSVYIVDQHSGSVISKVGGNDWKGISLHNESINQSNDITSGQHDAKWVNENEISIFDDQTLNSYPARGLLVSLNWNAHGFRILRKFSDPFGSNSYCTGSFSNSPTVPTFWVADWGCSKSGLTVFTNFGTPIVSIGISDISSNQVFLTAPFAAVKYQLGYKARISSIQ